VRAALAALGAGALVALSLPPWGWWPLAFAGIAILDHVVADRARGLGEVRVRFAKSEAPRHANCEQIGAGRDAYQEMEIAPASLGRGEQ